MTVHNIVAYGAMPAPADSRVAFQAAVTAAVPGDSIYVPNGTYYLSKAPSQFHSVTIPKTLRLYGQSRDGAVLAMSPSDAAVATPSGNTHRLINVQADDVQIDTLTLYGNKPNPGMVQWSAALEHHPALFATLSNRLHLQDITIRHFGGDGCQFYNGVTDVLVERCLIEENNRAGISLTGTDPADPVDGCTILDSQLLRCATQQVDAEHGVTRNVTVRGCVLTIGVNDYAMAISGTDADSLGAKWLVENNAIYGSVFIVWARNITIRNNNFANTSTKSVIEMSRACINVQVLRNSIHQAQMTAALLSGIYLEGTPGSAPQGILIAGNRIQVDQPNSFGVRTSGITSVEIADNELVGPGIAASGFYGIHLRATVDRDFERAIVFGNRIRDFGQRGLNIASSTGGLILDLDVRENQFYNTVVPAPMMVAMSFDDGAGAVQALTARDNQLGAGVVQDMISLPAGAVLDVTASKSGLGPQGRTLPATSSAALRNYYGIRRRPQMIGMLRSMVG